MDEPASQPLLFYDQDTSRRMDFVIGQYDVTPLDDACWQNFGTLLTGKVVVLRMTLKRPSLSVNRPRWAENLCAFHLEDGGVMDRRTAGRKIFVSLIRAIFFFFIKSSPYALFCCPTPSAAFRGDDEMWTALGVKVKTAHAPPPPHPTLTPPSPPLSQSFRYLRKFFFVIDRAAISGVTFVGGNSWLIDWALS